MICPLSNDGLLAVDTASSRILQEVGFVVDDPRAIQVLGDHGCEVDAASCRVRMSEATLRAAIALAPRRVVLADRRGSSFSLEPGGPFHVAPEIGLNVWDGRTRLVRPGTRQDTANLARLCDCLQHVDGVIPMVFPSDAPLQTASLHMACDTIVNTSKHVMSAFPKLEEVQPFLEMCALMTPSGSFAGDPTASVFLCPTSPLHLSSDTSAILRFAVERRVPVLVLAGPAIGGTSPLTIAGTLAQINAEVLFVIALAQMILPGASIVYGTAAMVMDMRTMHVNYGRVENTLLNGATAQLARHYGLPSCGCNGQIAGAEPAVRAGVEKMLSYAGVIGAGLNLGQGAGHHGEHAVSAEQLLIDSEIIGLAKQLFRTIRVDEEALGVSAIAEAGPCGNYLVSKHTIRWLRSGEYYRSAVLDLTAGDLLDHAHETVKRTLSEHVPSVDEEKVTAVRAYASEKEAELLARAQE